MLKGYGKYMYLNKARVGYFNGAFNLFGNGMLYVNGFVIAIGSFPGDSDEPLKVEEFSDFMENQIP